MGEPTSGASWEITARVARLYPSAREAFAGGGNRATGGRLGTVAQEREAVDSGSNLVSLPWPVWSTAGEWRAGNAGYRFLCCCRDGVDRTSDVYADSSSGGGLPSGRCP